MHSAIIGGRFGSLITHEDIRAHIRDMPTALHQRLKLEAEQHHRSMNREAIAIFEEALGAGEPASLPVPVKLKKPVDPQWIVKAIREGRQRNP